MVDNSDSNTGCSKTRTRTCLADNLLLSDPIIMQNMCQRENRGDMGILLHVILLFLANRIANFDSIPAWPRGFMPVLLLQIEAHVRLNGKMYLYDQAHIFELLFVDALFRKLLYNNSSRSVGDLICCPPKNARTFLLF